MPLTLCRSDSVRECLQARGRLRDRSERARDVPMPGASVQRQGHSAARPAASGLCWAARACQRRWASARIAVNESTCLRSDRLQHHQIKARFRASRRRACMITLAFHRAAYRRAGAWRASTARRSIEVGRRTNRTSVRQAVCALARTASSTTHRSAARLQRSARARTASPTERTASTVRHTAGGCAEDSPPTKSSVCQTLVGSAQEPDATPDTEQPVALEAEPGT
eukprot:1901510-Pleurochrysis_carterae.AAC.6